VLMHNQLEGGIPGELGKLSKLTYLLLGQNRLSGEIPQAIYNLSSLYELALELNMLVGELPSNIGDTLPNLQHLTLAINMLEGRIPSSIGNASGMWLMGLSGNRFTGQIPSSLGKLPNLSKLNLENNKLEATDQQSWQFLNALTNCSALELFSVHGNMLQGTLPDSVGNLSSILNILLFGSNRLSGLVPSSIGNLRNLTELGLEFNDFSGSIDGWVGKLVNLVGLFLNGNSLNGKIPSSMGNLTELSLLHLEYNQFNGQIPSSLGSLPQLSELYLSHNNLQGRIPNGVFTVATLVECVLSHNNLEGEIPGFSNLQQLAKLGLSSNKFIGAIPTTLGSCQELGTIRMDQNFLSGSIPTYLGNLSSLTVLNLSRNNLTGIIPAALSNLQVLNQLDLSYNNLEGEVPTRGVFKNVTAVSLKGNRDLCGGALELHMPTCTAVPHKIGQLKIWVKILIAVFGFVAPLLILSLNVIFRCKKTNIIQLPLVSYGEKFSKVSYKDLAQATENFAESNLIGRGSYGLVYRGNLIRAVAVKVFDMNMQGAERSVMLECNALRNIRHRNLLPILTVCSTIDNKGNDFRALVYEFKSNGNLDTWLHPGNRNVPNQLGLTQRIDIVVGIADALQYLHHDCESPIIHCDLKPSNILLDVDMTPHLGDFGIASFYLKSMSVRDMGSISSIGLKGTIGYIAPGNILCS
jgi:Leucine-rich repeat (LRR) protein